MLIIGRTYSHLSSPLEEWSTRLWRWLYFCFPKNPQYLFLCRTPLRSLHLSSLQAWRRQKGLEAERLAAEKLRCEEEQRRKAADVAGLLTSRSSILFIFSGQPR